MLLFAENKNLYLTWSIILNYSNIVSQFSSIDFQIKQASVYMDHQS